MRRSSATSPRSTAVLTAPGHEIVCDSKQTAQQLLQRLTDRFDDTMGETEGILADYEAAEQEIATLFAALNQQIDDVAQSAAQMLERAKAFTDIYREMQHTVSETRQGAEELLSAYEAQASEFLSGDADKVATRGGHRQPHSPAAGRSADRKSGKTRENPPRHGTFRPHPTGQAPRRRLRAGGRAPDGVPGGGRGGSIGTGTAGGRQRRPGDAASR